MNIPKVVHPTDRTLRCYAFGKLDDATADSVHVHLEGCKELRIVSCARDFSVRIWDVESGRAVLTVGNLDRHVRSVAFSPDARQFVTGSGDGVVRLRNTSDGKELAVIKAHACPVIAVAFSPVDRLVASAAGTSVRLWPLPADGATGAAVKTDSERKHG
jgi:WD40 repeat protein